ncbi:hypothetical protein B0H14DRAFT_2611874 [Mycena olivaceomarginata]|nr:hypothetical protein B0H14DRAFT_2611874 [Mycena olivaceomarginata]
MPTGTTLCWSASIPRLYEAEITEFGSKTQFILHAGALSLRPTVSTPAFSTGWAEILVIKHPILLREREMQLIYRTIGSIITSHSPCKSHQESGWNLRTEYIVPPIETLRLNWTSSTVMFKATYDRNPVELRFYKAPSRSAQKRERA